ncbi:DUF1697 domain-containing protein [Pseudonocardia acidicola]|uniref:DUF1697 domain-containing protein n=1 Tax=Pseudonocardia acidicola TaxID=2724939 RepID=A0ABX1S6N6_9PSEU|nr:DUF1697 domain-containing protein [Pseudonocardia acidicola]NMH96780.1 DUF1697 domain-containing protein [Pseudonocardia acidicola]
MPGYVALLRGINVGGNKKVAMADLRELLAGLGFTGVRTHLQSGNAVFGTRATTPDRLAGRIEQAVSRSFGIDVRCLVRTAAEMRAVVDGHPLAEVAGNGSRMMALFLSAAPEPALVVAHDPVVLDPERTRIGDRVIYQWCPDGVLKAPDVAGFVMKNWRVAVTGRNWNTVTALAELLEAGTGGTEGPGPSGRNRPGPD